MTKDKRGAALAASALGAFLCAATGCANETGSAGVGEDTSATIEPILNGAATTAYPEATLLTMRTSAGASYACSAVLIAPRVVLTAGHCVDGMVSWQATVNGILATSSQGRTMDWNENGSSNVDPAHHDVGVVFLDQAISLPSYPIIATSPVADGTQLIDVGRIDNGLLTNSFYKAPVVVSSGAQIGFAFDYSGNDVIEHGDSGGPVFLPLTHTVVAVNSGANGSVEVLARVDLVSRWIATQVAASKLSSDAPSVDAGSAAARSAPASVADAGAAAQDAAPTHMPSAGSTPPSDAGHPASARTCTSETESNDKVTAANPLADSECGALSTAADVDWFTFEANPGQTKVSLSAASDAALALGYVLQDSTCQVVVPASAGMTSALITIGQAATPVRVCVLVSSRAHKIQTYAVELARSNG